MKYYIQCVDFFLRFFVHFNHIVSLLNRAEGIHIIFFQNWGMGVNCPACGALVAIISLSGAYLLKY